MDRQSQIDQIIIACELKDEEIITYLQAGEQLSNYGSDAKIKAIPDKIKEKMTKFFKHLREIGVYSAGHKQGKLLWQEVVGYEEGWKRIIQNRKRSGIEPPDDLPF